MPAPAAVASLSGWLGVQGQLSGPVAGGEQYIKQK